MPSEDVRLHPATLLFDIAKHVKNFAIPSLFVIFGASQSSGGPAGMMRGMPSGWEGWLLVLFVPAILLSIARYVSFRLRYDGNELVIRSGVIFRNERHVPFSRIQNVDAIQNLFHRFFKVVEIRVETGGGKEEEARLSVLPYSVFEEMRGRVFDARPGTLLPEPSEPPEHPGTGAPLHLRHPAHRAHPVHLVHLDLRELLLCGFLENKGMVLIGAAMGVVWESGLGRFFEPLVGSTLSRGFFRDLFNAIFDDGPFPVGRMFVVLVLIPSLLVAIRVISMLWAFVRLYDFRLTRIGEDLRSEYGLFTKVTATVPIRRIQAVTINASPLQRWLKRASVQVATAGGSGAEGATKVSELLAPLIHQQSLPALLQHLVPGFDLSAVDWQPLHRRAFARAMKPLLVIAAGATAIAAIAPEVASFVAIAIVLLWGTLVTRKYVAHLTWADGDEVMVMRTGWLWQATIIARVNKIQAVTMHQSPFDRRAAMARVRVDTAGAVELSHRIDIPYLDHQIASTLAARLSSAAANTAFRW